MFYQFYFHLFFFPAAATIIILLAVCRSRDSDYDIQGSREEKRIFRVISWIITVFVTYMLTPYWAFGWWHPLPVFFDNFDMASVSYIFSCLCVMLGVWHLIKRSWGRLAISVIGMYMSGITNYLSMMFQLG